MQGPLLSGQPELEFLVTGRLASVRFGCMDEWRFAGALNRKVARMGRRRSKASYKMFA